MKHLISLLLTFLISATISAQTPADSVGVYAVHGDSIVRIEPKLADNFKHRAKSAYHFKGNTSETRFKGKAVLMLYLGEPSMGMSSRYMMFTVATTINDFGITKMGKRKSYRRVTDEECTFKFKKATDGHFHLYNTTMEITPVKENVYQIEIFTPPGEYCLVPIKTIFGGNLCIFDFTIE